MQSRTGLGYDVHALAAGHALIIGGVEIPYEKGSVGHSDGDALIHAVVDALLGAAALGDIGQFFPSDDPTWKGRSSVDFLTDAVARVRQAGLIVQHVDATIILQEPKLSEYIPAMRKKLAAVIGVDLSCVSVKATTTDRLGFTGAGEGWAVMAIATLAS
ncbi:MAG: 2-C-methyl-D-erythritol 2,4-cyclodiphosphate synthase [FCB group bacterium]|nr:2-C-methyl-D-erythritol 2,4-cyclodiphosphate synthase [FCB group bacterium]